MLLYHCKVMYQLNDTKFIGIQHFYCVYNTSFKYSED